MAQAPELLRSSLGCLKGHGSRKILKLDFFPFPRKVLPLCINDLFLKLCDEVTAGMCVWADLMNLPH